MELKSNEQVLIITNNPRIAKEFGEAENVEFLPEEGHMEILRRVRDDVHLGARLLMHPMAGRIKPHETPYRSILLLRTRGPLHIDSLLMIEDSIAQTQISLEHTFALKYSEAMLDDLQWIDSLLLRNAIEEYRR